MRPLVHIDRTDPSMTYSADPDRTGETPDLFVSQHCLEHVADPVAFLRRLRRRARGGVTRLFLEVPHGDELLRTLGIWDLIYEHVSQFTPASLETALARAGWEVEHLASTYDGQFLTAVARAADAATGKTPARRRLNPGDGSGLPGTDLAELARLLGEMEKTVREAVEARIADGRPRLLWGAGSKSVTFLHLFDTGATCSLKTYPPHGDSTNLTSPAVSRTVISIWTAISTW